MAKGTSRKISIEKNKLNLSRYRPEIDGLRAFAVVAVIINHFDKDILPGGYLGVDIFFMISGYVITSSLFGRPSKDFKDFISGFYERRVKRLVPALSVFVLIMSIAICLFNPSPGTSLKTGLTSLFGLSNLYLLKQSTDYFAQSTELNVFTHTWSLGVEEQFYILFPFLIWFSGFGRQTKNGARNLFLLVGILTIASLVGFLYLYPTNQPAAYFLMTSRFWEMAAGCLIFIGFQKRVSVEQLLEKIPPLLVLALIVGVMFLPMSMASASTVAVVALSSILIACLKKQTAAFKVFTNPIVVYIGLISYSLYLWHWGVLSISRWTIGVHWWSVPLQIALMIGLAVASYRWIETPLRKGNWFGKRWKTLVVGGGVLVTLSGGLVALAIPLGDKLFAGKKTEKIVSAYRYRGKQIDSRLSPEFTSKNCHGDLGADNHQMHFNLDKCFLGSQHNKTLYLLGNSHANHYRESAFLLYKNHNIGVFSITTGWCNFPLDPRQSLFKNCADPPSKIKLQMEVGTYLLENARKGDIVIISNRYPIFLDENLKNTNVWLEDKESIQYINALSDVLSSKGAALVLMLPSPELEFSPELCKEQWFRLNPDERCSEKRSSVIAKQKIARNLVARFLNPNVLVYDPTIYLCSEECSAIDEAGYFLYIDNNHITDYANEKIIYPSLSKFLEDRDLL